MIALGHLDDTREEMIVVAEVDARGLARGDMTVRGPGLREFRAGQRFERHAHAARTQRRGGTEPHGEQHVIGECVSQREALVTDAR